MKNLTALLAILGYSLLVDALAADVQAGKAAAAKYNCASCHGADYNSPIDPTYPRLAGQHADYLEHALLAYQRGTSTANGRSNAIMAGMAKALSRDEIRNIAAYLSGLRGALVQSR